MASSRQSGSSARSSETTAIDFDSPRPSPTMAENFEQRRDSCGPQSSLPRSTAQSSVSTLPRSLSEPYQPKDRHGWPRLADIMAEVPSFAAFPRFRDLNMRNLLFFKVQLDILREDILKMEDEQLIDMERYDTIVRGDNPEDQRYQHMLLELRELLKSYNDTLLQHSQVSALPNPEPHNMRSLRKWIGSDKDLEVLTRTGIDTTWGEPEEENSLRSHVRSVLTALFQAKPSTEFGKDLVVTHPEGKTDGLTKWIVYNLMPLYWRLRDAPRAKNPSKPPIELELRNLEAQQQDPEALQDREKPNAPRQRRDPETLETVSEATAFRFTSALSTVIASLTPIIAIAVLSQLSGTRDLLLCITGFAVIFAILLIFLTQGTSSRTEIFAATAAFSAVLVVFISDPPINIEILPGTDRLTVGT
ncbi:hypothetical protein C7974DRAFT_417018 [Boeremia exigua]|uniref:uncharacterized protein n=1 Tax=Boeremia exigua TaxID=749465 RepID=UPI001E8D9AB9|nr:uncharacterized protein C7974DRAFT_417018 [Boeremia exigua]KAH6614803.1 hypothetical protein C7974DRAFT_417018 [Boeremia exigua]